MKRSLSIFAACLLAGQLLPALEMPPGATLEPNGVLKIGNASLSFSAATASWSFRDNSKWQNIETRSGPDSLEFTGEFEFAGIQARAVEMIRQTGPNKYRVESEFRFPSPVFANAVFASVTIPLPTGALLVDGKPIAVPEAGGPPELLSSRQVRSLRVETPGGMIFLLSGNLRLMIQDNRKWWKNELSIRIAYTPGTGQLSEAALGFDLEIQSHGGFPVNPGGAANADSGFSKEKTLALAGFPFRIGGGKSAITVGGASPDRSVKLDLPAGTRARAVNLLHSADWNQMAGWLPEKGKPIGFLDVTYADGKQESIPVKTDIDCGHRATLNASHPNAVMAVTGEGDASATGFYASSFALSGDRPVSIVFRAAEPESVAWTAAAVTLSNRAVRFPAQQGRPFTIREGARWKRLDFERKIIAGSPLDFSRLRPLEAPAGKYGFVQAAPDGEFTFRNAPDKRIRFYGVNLCFSANIPDRETADEMVEYLVRMGYNTVRIHHQESVLMDKNAADSLTFDPVALDKLDYLFAKCKERGLYLTTDLYVNRRFRPGDNIGVRDPETLNNVKGLLPVNRAAMENWKEFARRWMNHKNPYTGMTWGEDPALATLLMVNEEALPLSWGRSPELIPVYRQKFEDWKREKGLPAKDHTAFNRFLGELETRMFEEQLDFVRNELKLKTMLSGTTGRCAMANRIDFTDEHGYFAHPSFPLNAWKPPIQFDAGSAIRNNASILRNFMPRRHFGKPLTVTEFNFCYPNPFRAEQGPLTGAYAALQNWGGLWRFTWSHGLGGLKTTTTLFPFDAVNDPMQQFSDRIVVALFLRGDMTPAKEIVSCRVPDDWEGSFPAGLDELGLNARTGWQYDGETLPAGARPFRPGMTVAPDPRLKLNRAAGTFTVVTERTETVTLPKGSLSAGTLRVKNADRFMTVAAISRDGKPLSASNDILIIHLTNISASNVPYADSDTCNGWGTLPLLVERGVAELELAARTPWRVAALATDGSELGEVPGEFRDGLFRFKADTGGFPGGVIAYHLTR